MKARPPLVVVHGGAGTFARALAEENAARAALRRALEAGQAALAAGGTALDAAVAAVQSMEDSGEFNAGKGAVTARDGSVSHDAAVMEGRGRTAGAVAAISGFSNPVLGARLVMERSGHVLLAGASAERFLSGEGLARAPAGYFRPVGPDKAPAAADTVGAVAVDQAGQLATATSTGGIRGKLPGRVGDSPIIGAGTYADERCAISATGTGELFVRAVFGFRVATLVAQGLAIDAATAEALAAVTALGGSGGCVAVTADGAVAWPFTTPAMPRGVIDAAGVARIALWPEDGPP